jgi:hypothetical protein
VSKIKREKCGNLSKLINQLNLIVSALDGSPLHDPLAGLDPLEAALEEGGLLDQNL